jgi:hypothetical protein
LGGTRKNLGNRPALRAAEGARFSNADAIPFLALIFFVVSFVSLRPDNDFSVLRVGRPIFNGDHDGFVHFVADD